MARNELEISISQAFNCNRCPNREKIEGIEYPRPDLSSCPRDELITQNRHPMTVTPVKSVCSAVIATSLRQ